VAFEPLGIEAEAPRDFLRADPLVWRGRRGRLGGRGLGQQPAAQQRLEHRHLRVQRDDDLSGELRDLAGIPGELVKGRQRGQRRRFIRCVSISLASSVDEGDEG
jgi:hypothetical protein